MHEAVTAKRGPGRPRTAMSGLAPAEQPVSSVEQPQSVGQLDTAVLADDNGETSPKKRVPFGSTQLKLDLPLRPGFHRHWFNDAPGRIDRARDAGYTHILDERTKEPMRRIVSAAAGGGGTWAYAMEIPQEFYNEDQALKEEQIAALEDQMKRGITDRPDGQYVPKKPDGTSFIKISRDR